ncbi:MAG TPA: hypothetical protein VHX60_04160 [Acidobacteriaceae bacterium]|jgi:hypothetical protein|nr:hypothetical protein [Acidobacteriaceae bacterium]
MRGVRVYSAGRGSLAVALALAAAGSLAAQQSPTQTFDGQQRDWMRRVRIAAYGLTPDNAQQIVQKATASGVYGIEVDNDIPGRYESLLDPSTKLEAIRRVAAAAHQANNKAFVYVAGLECISKNADGPHTLAKDHPGWLQRKITGEPAIFTSGAAFWIAKGEEDVWVSPWAPDWRKLYMQRIRQIAGTGIDGIYVDIPYWMTHFTGWEDTWASFDDATVAEFHRQTGLDARKDIKLGDAEDPGFRKWVAFRIQTIDDFMAEIRSNAVSVNPHIAVIPEIYPGIEDAAPRVGADVYQLYPLVDAIAHEYEFGDGDDHTAASRTPFDWFMYQIGMRSFRAFAQAKPTWILNYSWDGAPHVQPHDAMLNLASSQLAVGANFWDARGHVMSGSNDMPTRVEIFHWIAQHEDIFGAVREPVGETGVYFSDATRNLYPNEFVDSYRGVLLLLLQNHIQFQIVTPRTVAQFHGKVLVLPEVKIVSGEEASALERYAARGGSVVMTGAPDPLLASLPGARFAGRPEVEFLHRAQSNFSASDPGSEPDLLRAIESHTELRVTASKNVAVHQAHIGTRTYLFFANFDGLVAGGNATPVVQRDVEVVVPQALGATMHWLPFFGVETTLKGSAAPDGLHFTIPELDRGAVAWFAPAAR